MPVLIPYPKTKLEPAISARTLEVHERLWQKYDATTEKTLQKITDEAKTADTASMGANMEVLSFNACGNLLHAVYFSNMIPHKDSTPGMQTLNQLTERYGGENQFKAAFTAAANQLRGPGWAILGWDLANSRVEFVTASLHNNNALFGFAPILVLDLWEHAYFLDYYDDRAGYIDKWWGLVNWMDVEQRLVLAMQGVSLAGEMAL
jgi:Fe-Mn family superoxide dismutase